MVRPEIPIDQPNQSPTSVPVPAPARLPGPFSSTNWVVLGDETSRWFAPAPARPSGIMVPSTSRRQPGSPQRPWLATLSPIIPAKPAQCGQGSPILVGDPSAFPCPALGTEMLRPMRCCVIGMSMPSLRLRAAAGDPLDHEMDREILVKGRAQARSMPDRAVIDVVVPGGGLRRGAGPYRW